MNKARKKKPAVNKAAGKNKSVNAKPAKKPGKLAKPTVQSKEKSSQKAISPNSPENQKKEFPKRFPFWARLKISKRRTTLVIDEDEAWDKEHKRYVDGFVHREATHTQKKDFEPVIPNPDKDDPKPMYLKRPRKHPKRMFEPHNKNLAMPAALKERYEKNNRKGDGNVDPKGQKK